MNTLSFAHKRHHNHNGQAPQPNTTKLSKGEKDHVYYIIIFPSIYAKDPFCSPQLSYW